jgi:hypothetical protein
MKTQLIVFVLSILCLCGCQREAAREVPTHVFSIAAFKQNDAARVPSATELVSLKAFALSIYNPYSVPTAIDDDELKRLGFSLLLSGNQEVSMQEPLKQVCSQGLAWGNEPKRLQVFLKPVQGGVEVYAESGPSGTALTPSPKNFIGFGSIGTHVFGDGLVFAWVVKPIASKDQKANKARLGNPH